VPAGGDGNGRADFCKSDLISDGVNSGRSDNISATVPDTRGAEKLVPTLGAKLSE
jgi:hypothetical protein